MSQPQNITVYTPDLFVAEAIDLQYRRSLVPFTYTHEEGIHVYANIPLVDLPAIRSILIESCADAPYVLADSATNVAFEARIPKGESLELLIRQDETRTFLNDHQAPFTALLTA